MPDAKVFKNKIINIKSIPSNQTTIKIPFDLSVYGNFKRSNYDRFTNVNILNEPKLFTAPYMSINITNNQFTPLVSDVGYLYRTKNVLFNQNLDLYYKSKLFVDNYGLGDNDAKFHAIINESIDELPLVSDAYTEYLQNNMTQSTFFPIDLVLSTLSDVTSAASAKNPVLIGSAAAGTVSNLVNRIARKTDLKTQPKTIRNCGNNLIFDFMNNNIELFSYSVRPQEFYLKRAFNWFNRYGYSCNDFKIPNTRSRYYFNFIQTEDCNLKGDIPMDHLNTLKNIFNNGITLWHYRTPGNTDPDICNYSKENMEINLMEVM